MKYQVPQFIETEAKVVGPLTLKQFLYVAAGSILILIIGYTVPPGTAIYVAIFVAIIALALAFVKIDDMPLPRMIGLAIYYALNSKRYYFHPDATASKDELDQYLAIRKQGADNQQQ